MEERKFPCFTIKKHVVFWDLESGIITFLFPPSDAVCRFIPAQETPAGRIKMAHNERQPQNMQFECVVDIHDDSS